MAFTHFAKNVLIPTQPIYLSCELPLEAQESVSQHLTYDFAIANYCFDRRYAAFYRSQSDKGRIVILDNGAFETGKPMSFDMLFRACEIIQPTVVIAPDIIGDQKKTHRLSIEFRKELKEKKLNVPYIGAVVQGVGCSLNEQLQAYYAFADEGFEPLCLSFLFDRKPMVKCFTPRYDKWHHLLGLADWPEAVWLRENLPLCKLWSLDTVKPYKAALKALNSIEEMYPSYEPYEQARGKDKWSFTDTVSENIITETIKNVKILKELFHDDGKMEIK